MTLFSSRQKIDEAPTPFRYQSESDQSEAESNSDGERLAKKFISKDNSPSHLNPFTTNNVCDSWETVHAKLQYEKHLQDIKMQLPIEDDSMEEAGSEKFQQESLAMISSEEDIVVSPSGRRESSNGKSNNSTSVIKKTSSGNFSPSKQMIKKYNPTEKPKTVFIKPGESNFRFSNGEEAIVTSTNDNDRMFAGINGSIGGDGEVKQKFINKRATHYNEFKVLQAMRAKLESEDEEEMNENK